MLQMIHRKAPQGEGTLDVDRGGCNSVKGVRMSGSMISALAGSPEVTNRKLSKSRSTRWVSLCLSIFQPAA